jgi:hypothetical protein
VLTLIICLPVLQGCAHSSQEKGGLVEVTASAEAVSSAFRGRKFAVVVGIPQSSDPAWRPLRFAQKDADDLGRVLRDPLRGQFANVAVLSSPLDTTKAGLLEAAHRLALQAANGDDVMLFYVSAHGTLARDHRGTLRRYLVTSDAHMNDVSGTALSVEELQTVLNATASHRRVVVLATCHSGNGKSLLPQDMSDELASIKGGWIEQPLEVGSRASVVLSASDFGETAREDELLQNDIYTHFLVEGLSGAADRNGDGAVTATEAHDFARRRTWAFSAGRQRPSAELLEVGADPIVLAGTSDHLGRPELFSYAAHLDGVTVRVDGEPRGELPGGIAVDSGRHRLELTKGDTLLASDTVRVDVGERVDLETLFTNAEPSHAVSVLGGVVGFLNQARRSDLFSPTATFGASFRFDRVLVKALSFELDLAGFSGRQTLVLAGQAPVPFVGSTLVGGVSGLYSWHWGPLRLMIGPRVAALWVQRSFSTDVYRQAQSAFSVTPGAAVGVVWPFSKSFEASLMAQGLLSFFTLDGQTEVLGFAGAWASVGYRF